MRILSTLLLVLYTGNVTPEQEWTGWQTWSLGAPCSLKSDWQDGICYTPEVLKRPRIVRKGKK